MHLRPQSLPPKKNKNKIMKKKEPEVIFKKIEIQLEEHQKKIDEVGKVLYELFCTYRLRNSVHKEENNVNLEKEVL